MPHSYECDAFNIAHNDNLNQKHKNDCIESRIRELEKRVKALEAIIDDLVKRRID